MKNLKKRRRIQVIVLIVVSLVLSSALIGYGFKGGISLYRSPTQVFEANPEPEEVFKTGGLVVEGSMKSEGGVQFYFEITDGNNTMDVLYVGKDPKPDLFEEGQVTIATGSLKDGTFYATQLLAKHDETYMPKEIMDTVSDEVLEKIRAENVSHGKSDS
ncbi:cytochrome c maturation protein CcmE [Halocynthiibacter sp. C4]|uniref:cytochrome c maturation protein CcmE n=1 Tax=Halocynthiibacter sp. C4 TaxID=2992758 RepID=UPI00237B01F0|nr:cytochrome c maturation protein CcmE [Halocynthiibacter sp. C4]MDE0589805.1 cytochrome c maturation protein CcmE [Halocynthiibacter sp. C4]